MRQWTVDAFAAEAFRGNPACVLEPFADWPDAAWMQALAAENNQAETAFLLRTADPARFGLRWFTPALEVPLCGHATLASGHVLFAELGLTADAVVFDTKSGPLTVRRFGEDYEMDFPAQPPRQIATPAGLAEALGVEPLEVWASTYLVAVLNDEAQVLGAAPDLVKLEAVSSSATGGRGNVGVAALADAGAAYDVVDRFFAPGSGIPEDPATGSLHTILAPLYADKLGRARVSFRQAYPGRGGDLDCEMTGERVLLRGRAVTVLDGTLRVGAA
ncbi:PhzF family phenazine biosynthesis protein [Phenylobacterium sp.]|uniref:PhzF family phenazine biosynthesis protein n=1 Tax=Phenylobacterium sp. TaxID=1871053 RepID=UPI0012046F9B|nr:PhzF family phenazine biosynthesis protein [Phenylobacterium sp.]THD62413.1 MAG: PhzF family phenazine biosynthesis protein [Phenylobacterium sp.]